MPDVATVVDMEIARRIYGDLDALSLTVKDCERSWGKYHSWVTMKVDIRQPAVGIIDVDICKRCYVRRCTAIVHEGSMCIWPTEHLHKHMDELRYERARTAV